MTDRGAGGAAWVSGLVTLAVMALAVHTCAAQSLEERVDAVVRSPGYAMGHWGLLVVDGKSGKTVFERNADQMFCPASVTKLFTTATALSDLGADYRFVTPLVRRGEIDKSGVLHGDLILVAQGDLSLGGRTGEDGTLQFVDDDHTYANGNPRSGIVKTDPLAGLDHLARELVALGVKRVTGEVLVDDRLFEATTSTGSGPTRVSPIVVNDNLVDLVITPGARAGETALVRLVPETSYIQADIHIETTDAGQAPSIDVKSAGSRRIVVRGHVPAGHDPIVKVAEVDDPASFARTLLIESLRRRGLRIDAATVSDNPAATLPSRSEVAGLPRVAEYTSPPLREYIKVILKVSHNLHASTLPLLVAVHHGKSTLADGLRQEGTILRSLGVEPGPVSFGGGAGGARVDLVTPRATVTLLRAMSTRPDFPAYQAALPVLGRDGTLARTVGPDSPARGHVRAKTGTYSLENGLNGRAVLTSKALAGYLETASGRPLVFAFFVNEVPLDVAEEQLSEATAAAGRLLGRLCEVFYRLDDTTPPASGGSQ